MPDETKPFDIDDFALRFIDQAMKTWGRYNLPFAALANAMTVRGLQIATEDAGPAEVSEGLQRIADAIADAEPPTPRHLV